MEKQMRLKRIMIVPIVAFFLSSIIVMGEAVFGYLRHQSVLYTVLLAVSALQFCAAIFLWWTVYARKVS